MRACVVACLFVRVRACVLLYECALPHARGPVSVKGNVRSIEWRCMLDEFLILATAVLRKSCSPQFCLVNMFNVVDILRMDR